MNSNQANHSRMESSQSANSFGTLVPSPRASTFSAPKNATDPSSSLPPIIPTHHPHRTLVVCFDGTGNQFELDNSNIVDFVSLLNKDDPSKQLVYYQPGIGTYTVPQIVSPFFAKMRKLADEAVAWDLNAHVMQGYKFLMENYAANDRICIFGFSRGAYTARCLAGMIYKIGLLPIGNHQQIPFAYKMYTRDDEVGKKQSKAFKKTFSTNVDIEFLGVWDSVNSVGLIPYYLPFSRSNPVVRTFRHALSLDERRVKFKANTWSWSNTDEKIAGDMHTKRKSGVKDHKHHHMLESMSGDDERSHTNVDEVWFSGTHGDVGGGCVENGVKPCTARIPLRWMIRECFKTKSGILFNTDGMNEIGLDPTSLHPTVRPRPPAIPISSLKPPLFITDPPKSSKPKKTTTITDEEEHTPETEEEAELYDSLAPIYDQLTLNWFWWILELIPLIRKVKKEGNNKWIVSFGWNLGSGRHIPQQSLRGVRVHRSVKTRLEAEYVDGRKYLPSAKLELEDVTWVD